MPPLERSLTWVLDAGQLVHEYKGFSVVLILIASKHSSDNPEP